MRLPYRVGYFGRNEAARAQISKIILKIHSVAVLHSSNRVAEEQSFVRALLDLYFANALEARTTSLEYFNALAQIVVSTSSRALRTPSTKSNSHPCLMGSLWNV